MDETILQDIKTRLTVPVWPHAGQALGLGRNASYEAAGRGEIESRRFGRRLVVPTAWLREVLHISEGA